MGALFKSDQIFQMEGWKISLRNGFTNPHDEIANALSGCPNERNMDLFDMGFDANGTVKITRFVRDDHHLFRPSGLVAADSVAADANGTLEWICYFLLRNLQRESGQSLTSRAVNYHRSLGRSEAARSARGDIIFFYSLSMKCHGTFSGISANRNPSLRCETAEVQVWSYQEPSKAVAALQYSH